VKKLALQACQELNLLVLLLKIHIGAHVPINAKKILLPMLSQPHAQELLLVLSVSLDLILLTNASKPV
jgi:hypothetical protein